MIHGCLCLSDARSKGRPGSMRFTRLVVTGATIGSLRPASTRAGPGRGRSPPQDGAHPRALALLKEARSPEATPAQRERAMGRSSANDALGLGTAVFLLPFAALLAAALVAFFLA